MTRRPLFALVASLLLAPALLAFQWTNQKKSKPRDTTIRNVEGVVSTPDDEPASGAVVKLKNLKTLQIRSFITKADGKFLFRDLSTSIDYELESQHKNLASPKKLLSVFDSRLDAVINLKLEPAPDAPASGDAKKNKSQD